MIAVFLFLFCARFVNSETKTVIQWATPNQSAKVNETIKLQCRVDNIGNKVLTWSRKDKNNELLIATNDFLLIPSEDNHVKYEVSREGGTYTLKVNDVSEYDVGEYKCSIALNSSYVLSKSTRVTVRSPISFLENTTSAITTHVGSQAKLECYVSGSEPLHLTWTKENNGLLPTGSTTYEGSVLRIDRVRKEYAGTYFCTAQNDVNNVKKTFKLHVEFEPEIKVTKKRVGQALQNKSELECQIAAFPEPKIVWLKDNKTIDMDQNVRISKSALPDAITTSKLEITVVNRTQYGNYTCKAENSMGHHQETIEFYETADVQCSTATCGAKFDYPDCKFIFSTTFMLVLLTFRW